MTNGISGILTALLIGLEIYLIFIGYKSYAIHILMVSFILMNIIRLVIDLRNMSKLDEFTIWLVMNEAKKTQ